MEKTTEEYLACVRRANELLIVENKTLRDQLRLYHENCGLRAASIMTSLMTWLDSANFAAQPKHCAMRKLEDLLTCSYEPATNSEREDILASTSKNASTRLDEIRKYQAELQREHFEDQVGNRRKNKRSLSPERNTDHPIETARHTDEYMKYYNETYDEPQTQEQDEYWELSASQGSGGYTGPMNDAWYSHSTASASISGTENQHEMKRPGRDPMLSKLRHTPSYNIARKNPVGPAVGGSPSHTSIYNPTLSFDLAPTPDYSMIGLPVAASTPGKTGRRMSNTVPTQRILAMEQMAQDHQRKGNEYFARLPPKQVHANPDYNAIEKFLNNANPNKRLIGEIAFQLDRRILNYVFNVGDQPQKRRFYGYIIQNIPSMIQREATNPHTGKFDPEKAAAIKYRYDYIVHSLRPLGFDIAVHPEVTTNLVNRYGLLPVPANSETAALFCERNKNFIEKYLRKITPPNDLPNILILFNCLTLLAQDEGKAIFIW